MHLLYTHFTLTCVMNYYCKGEVDFLDYMKCNYFLCFISAGLFFFF